MGDVRVARRAARRDPRGVIARRLVELDPELPPEDAIALAMDLWRAVGERGWRTGRSPHVLRWAVAGALTAHQPQPDSTCTCGLAFRDEFIFHQAREVMEAIERAESQPVGSGSAVVVSDGW